MPAITSSGSNTATASFPTKRRPPHRMPKTQSAGFAVIGDGAGVHVSAGENLQLVSLALHGQFGAQMRGLVDRVLYQRSVDQGHDFLRDRLGGRQETGAETGNGKNGFD
jgi:hypothetical protein